jgi:hypothetical protein
MKRQAEEAENQNKATNMFENSMPEAQQDQEQASSSAQSKANSTSGAGSSKSATRHRASIACASCRDRRIRVSLNLLVLAERWLTMCSVSCLLENEIVLNVNARRQNASLEMMTKDDGWYSCHFRKPRLTSQANFESIYVFPHRQGCDARRNASRKWKRDTSRKLSSQNPRRGSNSPKRYRIEQQSIFPASEDHNPSKHAGGVNRWRQWISK